MDTQKQTIGNRGWMVALLVLAILVIDQVLKIWVKTNMSLHESIEIASWFKIAFIENNGMAFGMEIGSKIFLSVFRVVAVIGLSYYIWLQLKEKARIGYVVLLAMILAGAIGNLIDCMFYGLIFNVSTPYNVAEFVSFGDGPIFNFADANVSVGIIALLLFYRKELSKISFSKPKPVTEDVEDAEE